MLYGLQNIDFSAITQHHGAPMPHSLEDEAQKALRLASWSARAVVTLQAIAAVAALGVFVIQWKTYCDNKRSRRRER